MKITELIEKPLEVSEEHYLLKIKSDEKPLPGQFINIRVQDGTDPLIRRPFSVFNYENSILEIIVKVAGRGTRILSSRSPGMIDIIGPLGKGFTLPENRNVLIAGGGVGNAPLYYLSKVLSERGCRITYLYGANRADNIFLEKYYSSASDEFFLFTDDGSKGERGYVTSGIETLLHRSQKKFDIIYVCGPLAMIKKSSEITGDIPLEVSMENYFGCGIGLCMGCSVETLNGLKRACVEGPVFNGHEIDWLNLSR